VLVVVQVVVAQVMALDWAALAVQLLLGKVIMAAHLQLLLTTVLVAVAVLVQ
jgi:hypothetical protein